MVASPEEGPEIEAEIEAELQLRASGQLLVQLERQRPPSPLLSDDAMLAALSEGLAAE